MKQFDITYFYGPSSEEMIEQADCIANIAASGITLCQIYGKTTEANKTVLRLMKNYGLRGNIWDEPRIKDLIRTGNFEQVDAVVKEMVDDYAGCDNLAGWDIFDEPTSDTFQILAAVQAALKKYDPDREVAVNLFPNYATPEQYKDTDYVTHVNRFVETVHPDFISYDNYPFKGRTNPNQQEVSNRDVDERERLIRLNATGSKDRDDFFENLEIIRHIGLKNELEQMLIVLLSEHGNYRNLTKAELTWEVNMCLAYGMHRISYFTYWIPEDNDPYWCYDNSMCNRKGEKFQHYYDVQEINEKIKPIGEILFKTKSTAVYHVGTLEKGVKAFESFGGVNSIDGKNAVIGFFEDGSAYLVNRDFREANTLTIHANKEIAVYQDGKYRAVGTDYTVTLSAGQAVLLRL